MAKDPAEFPGKEGLMITVEYPPGGSDPVRHHNAYGFVYVLEGSVVMQVKGGKEITLTPGQSFYEGPNDVHVLGRDLPPSSLPILTIKLTPLRQHRGLARRLSHESSRSIEACATVQLSFSSS